MIFDFSSALNGENFESMQDVRYTRVDGHVYITDTGIVKWLSQCKQLYLLSEIIFMLKLGTLPTDFSDLSDNVEFFLNT
jgi:hypothetical protein